jgi:hypothetical protein
LAGLSTGRAHGVAADCGAGSLDAAPPGSVRLNFRFFGYNQMLNLSHGCYAGLLEAALFDDELGIEEAA